MNNLENLKKAVTNSVVVDIEYKYNNIIKHVFAECGWFSLTGSIKDRVAYQIFVDAINENKINKNTKVVEVSSGNMGISVCAIANLLKLKTTIIMPKTMSEERKKLLKLYGAELVLVNNFKEAFNLCLKYERRGYFCPHQFKNKSNTKSHFKFTGKNLYKKLKHKKVTNFVAGIGTSGTLMGTGMLLKQKLKLKIYAIEPQNAPILTKSNKLKKHQLQGLADEIVPEIYNKNIVDNIIQIKDNDAIAMSQKLCQKLSLGVGISSGANFLGCVLSNENAATVFADCNKKYLSTSLTQNVHSDLVDKIELINVNVL